MMWPLWLDEGWDLTWSHRIVEGRIFTGIHSNKWLAPALVALFSPMGPEGPFLARVVPVLSGTLATAGMMHLGRLLGNRTTSLVAGLLYAILPLTLFYDRQALVEGPLAMFLVLALMAMIHLAQHPRWWLIPLTALSLSAAYLTKTTAVPYLALPIAAAVALAPPKHRKRAAAYSLLSMAAAWGLNQLVFALAARTGVVVAPGWETSLSNTILARMDDPEVWVKVIGDVRAIGETLTAYLGYAMLVLLALAIGWAARNQARREIVFLAVPAFAFMVVPILADLASMSLYSRFIIPNAPPLILMAALSLNLLLQQVDRFHPAARPIALVGFLGAIGVPALVFAWLFIHSPAQTPLTSLDRAIYQVVLDYDTHLRDVANDLLEVHRSEPDRGVDVLVEWREEQLAAYLGPRVGQASRAAMSPLLSWLARGDQVYVLDDKPESNLVPDALTGVEVEQVERYDAPFSQMTLYRVVGVEGWQVNRLYEHTAPPAAQMTADFEALGDWMDATGRSATTYLFPAGHAEALRDQTAHRVRGLRADRWPLDPEAAGRALDFAGLAPTPDARWIEVILVDEARSDPQRGFLTSLQQRLYRVDETWFGLLHYLAYLTGPEAAPADQATVFEAGITLHGALVDHDLAPGSPLRIALQWQTPVPIENSYAIFTHVVAADQTIVAQADGIPGGGLLPMTVWEPNQPITDRFAILLPVDLSEGIYEVRIGIYHPDSGLRLPVLSGAGSDYGVIGQIRVQP